MCVRVLGAAEGATNVIYLRVLSEGEMNPM